MYDTSKEALCHRLVQGQPAKAATMLMQCGLLQFVLLQLSYALTRPNSGGQ